MTPWTSCGRWRGGSTWTPAPCSPTTGARTCARAVVREATPLSLPAIGRVFGGRDHTTVMHAIRRVMRDETLRESVGLVVEELTLARRPALFAEEEVG
jgi:hypothetical protein